jgi:phage head maturation protease
LGDETLTLANDGLLDASAGFMPLGPDGEQWEGTNRRRIQKAYLAHVAFVPEPAYQGARVLSVRSHGLTEPPGGFSTPNLDEVRAWIVGLKYPPLVR